ncbi:alpha/beta fold hydrolase [[Flexibacter] sp. ATCC 35208]|uniref:alpha/beta fold hydrolase n=1 Tax=[Flexibacter] sp. ATCC 35208 TaxID=1936242 RepID=UPI0009CDDB90|nr:alpha/beta hydrolase [[Flexibacter] sp. ATCC 35208]OMP77525.1 alpha/beta hydrolase [[Flexibacter] sp. ATCC 35208]
MKKPQLLLLHGAIGASQQLKAIAEALSPHYTIHLFDFPGHGGQPLPEEPFSIALFAEAVADHIRSQQLEDLTIFGASMGGYVALHLAAAHPSLVDWIITLGTKFHWDPATAEKETEMLNPETMLAKVPAFAKALEKMHAPNDWKIIVKKTAEMMLAMGTHNPLQPDDYKNISTPTLILLGDRDRMVSFEETLQTYKLLPDAGLGVLPHTQHPAELVNAQLLAYIISANQSSKKPIAG